MDYLEGTEAIANSTMMNSNLTDIHIPVNISMPAKNLPRDIQFVISGIIIPAGLIFNTIALIVFITSKTLLKTITSRYLIALSIADSIFLIGELFRWMSDDRTTFNIGIHILDTSDILCKIVHFIRYGGKLTSSWITVAITTDRLLMVSRPLKYGHRSSPYRSTKIIIITIYSLSFTFASFTLWSVGVPRYGCQIVHEVWYKVGAWLTLRIGSLILPGIIILIMTGIIIHYMMHAKTERDHKLGSRRLYQRQNTIERKASIERQLTTMLVTVALVFVFLRMPYTITFYINQYKKEIWPLLSSWSSYKIYFINKMADTLATINYTVNFFLYFVCGSEFRKQLRHLLDFQWCKQNDVLSGMDSWKKGSKLRLGSKRSINSSIKSPTELKTFK